MADDLIATNMTLWDENTRLRARVAELEKALDEAFAFIKKQTDDKITLYDAQYNLQQRIAALEAALKPFADLADKYGGDIDEQDLWDRDFMPKVGDLRAARAAMEK
jgi:ABC-type nitrate/sulfonate/bicarbonate transport system substrate-binding protein